MLRGLRLVPLVRRPARRLLSTPADGVRAVVLRIAEQHAAGAPGDLNADLPTKFEVRAKKLRMCFSLPFLTLSSLSLRRSCSRRVSANLVWRCRTSHSTRSSQLTTR